MRPSTAIAVALQKEYMARLYHPETAADTSVIRDTRRAGRDPEQTAAFW